MINTRNQKLAESNNSKKMVQFSHVETACEREQYNNKIKLLNCRSDGDLKMYSLPLNNDPHPDIITKKSQQSINYVQELAVRYLKPPTPQPSGEIVIQQMADVQSPAPPSLFIRQQSQSNRAKTPEKLIIREAPPKPPSVSSKIITVRGKSVQAPQKLIIYRQAPVPQKPPPIIIERWLPYGKIKRKVIFEKADTCEQTPLASAKSTTSLKNFSQGVHMKEEIFNSLASKIFSIMDASNSGYIKVKDANKLYERFKDRLSMHNTASSTTSTVSSRSSGTSPPNFENKKSDFVSFEEFKNCLFEYYKNENFN